MGLQERAFILDFGVVTNSIVMNSSAEDYWLSRLVEHAASFTTCSCTHLTNFAVLMDINGNLKDRWQT
jgi:hypothetical protein